MKEWSGAEKCTYSLLKTSTGSTRLARRAGIKVPKTTIPDMTMATLAMASGSTGLTPRRKLRNKAAYQYDHYFNKITRLRSNRDKVIKKRGGMNYKEQQRLERNEEKYERAKAHFVAINEEVGPILPLFVMGRG